MSSYGQQPNITLQRTGEFALLAFRRAADGTCWVRRAPYPVLMVRDEDDAISQPFGAYMLLSAATTPGALVPAITHVTLPNMVRGPAGSPSGACGEGTGWWANAATISATERRP